LGNALSIKSLEAKSTRGGKRGQKRGDAQQSVQRKVSTLLKQKASQECMRKAEGEKKKGTGGPRSALRGPSGHPEKDAEVQGRLLVRKEEGPR